MSIYTEAEARTQWCPFARPVFPIDCGVTPGTRPMGEGHWTEVSGTFCLGSSCMAWRWYPHADKIGFCGLAGIPK